MLFEIIGEEGIILEWRAIARYNFFTRDGRSLFLHRKVDRPAVSGIVSQ
ncbi:MULTISPECIES: hypothetical protein [unclassified Microcoleus]